MSFSRREFFGVASTAPAAASAAFQEELTGGSIDGPASPNFFPIPLEGNVSFAELRKAGLSEAAAAASSQAPKGACVCWGIPFEVRSPVVVTVNPVVVQLNPFRAGWLVFLHTTDWSPPETGQDGFIRPMRGEGRLGEHVADYVMLYGDGAESRVTIRRRFQIGMFRTVYGDNCFQAVAHIKPFAVRPLHEQSPNFYGWGGGEIRARNLDRGPWINWVWAWKNPQPDKEIRSLRIEPAAGQLILSGLAGGWAASEPLQWRARRKALLRLPDGIAFDFTVDRLGRRRQVELDLGQVISVEPRTVYPDPDWETGPAAASPQASSRELLVEYTSSPDARFHLWDGSRIPVADLETRGDSGPFTRVKPAVQRVRIRVLDKNSGRPVPARLHMHGEAGEYLAPLSRHRYINPSWFEDYGPELLAGTHHRCTYIPGETVADLPAGTVYVEVSRGFEVRPLRQVIQIGPETTTVELVLDKVLPWRERGWVTADTHVHFLSPPTARLEGAAEGVNVVNLLASQWGELLTNVADFDGRTTFGAKEAGGDGEYLVRVGTENRQRVLGHISLLGYEGDIIAPMCAGGPDEAALGDPVAALLMEWAERCKQQGGLVISPHFPSPRGESAALVSGLVDGVELSWTTTRGINPYSLSDYYRYLNCGYFLAAVGGTDKMSARTAVGALRTYARIPPGRQFSYDSWKEAVRRGDTFATCGPLLEFFVEGKPPGSTIHLPPGGGTLNVTWEAASVTTPLSRVELVVNGEIRESRSLRPDHDSGSWRLRLERSSWAALLVRARQPGSPEIIGAHSSPVMIRVEGSQFHSPVDMLTILQQIEGTLAYLDTVGTRAEDEAYKRVRLRLTSVYRALHNELHQLGYFHNHPAAFRHV